MQDIINETPNQQYWVKNRHGATTRASSGCCELAVRTLVTLTLLELPMYSSELLQCVLFQGKITSVGKYQPSIISGSEPALSTLITSALLHTNYNACSMRVEKKKLRVSHINFHIYKASGVEKLGCAYWGMHFKIYFINIKISILSTFRECSPHTLDCNLAWLLMKLISCQGF